MSDSEKVLASFRKFDADSSGAISREELGEVLKATRTRETKQKRGRLESLERV